MFVNEGHQIAYCQSLQEYGLVDYRLDSFICCQTQMAKHNCSHHFEQSGEGVAAASHLVLLKRRRSIESQMKIHRSMYSNPPINGARIATEILNNL